jgi:hypothetical protein
MKAWHSTVEKTLASSASGSSHIPCQHPSLNPISASAAARAACQRPGEQWGGRWRGPLSPLPCAFSPPFPFLSFLPFLSSAPVAFGGLASGLARSTWGGIDGLEGRSTVPRCHCFLECFARLFQLCGLVLSIWFDATLFPCKFLVLCRQLWVVALMFGLA